MSSSDAVLTTLLLQKGVVRCYSTLDSDVGKRVVITDKFKPSSVKEGTLDASLNLLFELPAFTTYNVKMYGLDGETVESNQDFKLDGYSYVEMNIGLNKNSFAGIKAIVDQGLEDSMIEIGHEFSEDDNVGDNGGVWIVVAKNMDKEYNHSVFLKRKYAVPDVWSGTSYDPYSHNDNNVFTRQLDETYYEGLPSSIKDAIQERNIIAFNGNASSGSGTYIWKYHKVWNMSYVERFGNTDCAHQAQSGRVSKPRDNEVLNCSQFSYYINNPNVYEGVKTMANTNCYLRSTLYTGANLGAYMAGPFIQNNGTNLSSSKNCYLWYPGDQGSFNTLPCMMIASEPIE